MVTGRDVAARAQVSTATVSRVLSGAPGVSEALRERVANAAADLGYHPNGLARSLRARATYTLSLVVPNVLNPFFTVLARAVEDAARVHGYRVMLGNSDEQPEQQDSYLDGLLESRADGLLLSPADGSTSPAVSELVTRGLPVVLVDRALPDAGLPVVRSDNVGASRDVARHLLSLGHRRLGVLGGPPYLGNARERLDGFRSAAAEHGRPLAGEHVVVGRFDESTGSAGMRALLDTGQPPTAVFCCNNLITLGALRALAERGLRVPHEVALVSFDDVAWFELLDPPITAVRQPTRAIGRVAMETLLARIRGEQVTPADVRLPAKIVVRGSCGAGVEPASPSPTGREAR